MCISTRTSTCRRFMRLGYAATVIDNQYIFPDLLAVTAVIAKSTRDHTDVNKGHSAHHIRVPLWISHQGRRQQKVVSCTRTFSCDLSKGA